LLGADCGAAGIGDEERQALAVLALTPRRGIVPSGLLG
jgi:hypothetical protein